MMVQMVFYMAEDKNRKIIQNKNDEILPLLSEVRNLIITARKTAAQNINILQVLTNFEIGKLIVENEQLGDNRAEYGKQTLKDLSKSLTREFGRGFSRSNLEYMRRFFIEYRICAPAISQTVSGKLDDGTYSPSKITQTVSAQLSHFDLSWSHYVFLMGIKGRDERRFYEIESTENSWSLAELKRQSNSGLYERLALSRDKKGVRELDPYRLSIVFFSGMNLVANAIEQGCMLTTDIGVGIIPFSKITGDGWGRELLFLSPQNHQSCLSTSHTEK